MALLGESAEAAATLVRDGLVRESLGWLSVEPTADSTVGSTPPDAASVRRVAAALLALGSRAPVDPWALAHAAELCVRAGDFAAADDAMDLGARSARRLCRAGRDDRALGRRHRGLPAGANGSALQRAAAAGARAAKPRSDILGEGCRRADARRRRRDDAARQVAGRARRFRGRGGHLRRAARKLDAASEAPLAALVAAELAEVAYLKGELGAAREAAESALRAAGSVHGAEAHEAVAKARNTLGKILLAEARWDDADRHFAEDALTAASHGDTTSELRARLNRGIAFL